MTEQRVEGGNLFTVEEFLECVQSGGFIDYDGFGKYYDGKKTVDGLVFPSEVVKNGLKPGFTHIVWYNR